MSRVELMEALKVDVLKTLYVQQQATAHMLRERISKISIGTITLFVVIDGWVITNRLILAGSHVMLLTVSIFVIVGIAVYGVYARYKGFSAVARLIVRIEIGMKVYEVALLLGHEPLYPGEYENLGKTYTDEAQNIMNKVYQELDTIPLFDPGTPPNITISSENGN